MNYSLPFNHQPQFFQAGNAPRQFAPPPDPRRDAFFSGGAFAPSPLYNSLPTAPPQFSTATPSGWGGVQNGGYQFEPPLRQFLPDPFQPLYSPTGLPTTPYGTAPMDAFYGAGQGNSLYNQGSPTPIGYGGGYGNESTAFPLGGYGQRPAPTYPTVVEQYAQHGYNQARFSPRQGDVRLQQRLYQGSHQQAQATGIRGNVFFNVQGRAHQGNMARLNDIWGNATLSYQNYAGNNQVLLRNVSGNVNANLLARDGYNQLGVENQANPNPDSYRLSGASSLFLNQVAGEQHVLLNAAEDNRGTENYVTFHKSAGEARVLLGEQDSLILNTNGANGDVTTILRLASKDVQINMETANAGHRDTLILEAAEPLSIDELRQCLTIQHFDENDRIILRVEGEEDQVIAGVDLLQFTRPEIADDSTMVLNTELSAEAPLELTEDKMLMEENDLELMNG